MNPQGLGLRKRAAASRFCQRLKNRVSACWPNRRAMKKGPVAPNKTVAKFMTIPARNPKSTPPATGNKLTGTIKQAAAYNTTKTGSDKGLPFKASIK